MNKIKIFLTLFIFLTASYLHIIAQPRSSSPPRNMSSKNVGSESIHIVKLDLWETICGDLSVVYEHKFPSVASLEVGVGVLMPYYLNLNLSGLIPKNFRSNSNFKFSPDKVGFSCQLGVNFYTYQTNDGAGLTFGPYGRYRMFSNVHVADFGAKAIYKFIFWEHFNLDIGTKIFCVYQKSRDGQTTFFDISNRMSSSPFRKIKFDATLIIQIGYVF